MDCKDLQKMENRNISVITNFGCRANCWYCIWKGHKLETVNLDTDWNKLEQFLEQYKDKGKVSLSGGGDCLYQFDQHKYWWDRFLKLIEDKQLKLDIHTREKVDYLDQFWKTFLVKLIVLYLVVIIWMLLIKIFLVGIVDIVYQIEIISYG